MSTSAQFQRGMLTTGVLDIGVGAVCCLLSLVQSGVQRGKGVLDCQYSAKTSCIEVRAARGR
eukprot:4265076-Alexandrium_andersonii.AAC.1